jgi:predicted DNA-binding ribbon-helix-helix protein
MTTQHERTSTLYDRDYYLWLETTIQLLREQKLAQIDRENLIEELEDMGKSEKHSLKSNLRVLLMHLLKWQYQASRRSNSWDYTISEHRLRIVDAFSDSPSLKHYFDRVFQECYANARNLASKETGLPLDTFPLECPYLQNDVLNPDYLPD